MTLEQAGSSSGEPGEVVPLRIGAPAETPEQPHELRQQYVATIRAAVDVLNARLLALLALLGALAMWAWCVIDPTPWRFIGCVGFSIGVLWPAIWHSWKRG